MQEEKALYQSFHQAFIQFYESLCQYAYALVKESQAAEDIVQEIFVRVWEKKKDLVGSPDLKFYLYTAVRNNCITYAQKNKRSPVTSLTGQEVAIAPANPLPEKKTERSFEELLEEGLDRLPPRCREVFVLSRMSKLTYQQIADALGISVKTVENQMGKALSVLRAYVKEKQVNFVGLPLIFSLMAMKCIGVYCGFMLL